LSVSVVIFGKGREGSTGLVGDGVLICDGVIRSYVPERRDEALV
jgi:hypothetical protein